MSTTLPLPDGEQPPGTPGDDYRVLQRLPRIEEILCQPTHHEGLTRIAFVDCETTGLDTARDDLIELAIAAAIFNSSGELVRIYPCRSWVEQPSRPLEPKITQITGLTDSDLWGNRFDERVITRALNWADVIVSHNAAFDQAFLARRFPDAMAGRSWGCTANDVDWLALGFGGRSLFQLMTEAGYFYPAHRAAPDAWALMWLMTRPAGDGSTLAAHLLDAIARPSLRIFAEGAPISIKDQLKSRGYRWNPVERVWWIDIALDQEWSERMWLDEVCPLIRPHIELRSSTDRYNGC